MISHELTTRLIDRPRRFRPLPRDGKIDFVCVSTDNLHFATVSARHIKLWKVGEEHSLRTYAPRSRDVRWETNVISFACDNRVLYEGSVYGLIRVELESSNHNHKVFFHNEGEIIAMGTAPKSSLIVCGWLEGDMVVFHEDDPSTRLQSIRSNPLSLVSMTYEGETIATCTTDKMFLVWSLVKTDQSQEQYILQQRQLDHEDVVWGCLLSPRGTLAVSATALDDKSAFHLWDLTKGQRVLSWNPSVQIDMYEVSRDFSFYIGIDVNGNVLRWDLTKRSQVHVTTIRTSMQYSALGLFDALCVFGSTDGSVTLLDTYHEERNGLLAFQFGRFLPSDIMKAVKPLLIPGSSVLPQV